MEFSHLVTRLVGDGVSAKAYCSKAPMKLGGGFCSASMAFVRDRIIRNRVSVTSSDEEEDAELSRALYISLAFLCCSRKLIASARDSSGNLLMASLN